MKTCKSNIKQIKQNTRIRIIREDLVARMGEMINVYKALVGERECKRALGRPRYGW
jgi:hypothetical protein